MSALKKHDASATTGRGGFLGVVKSAKGLSWHERLAPDAVPAATAMAQKHGLSELMGRVLAARGASVEEAARFLDPTIKALMPDPSQLRDMDKASRRIADAIAAHAPVAIFGDYDVDGACSSALLARYLASHGVPARIYIPDRIFEGYGPNANAIEQLVKEGAKLIVTVDCGTTSFVPLQRAKDLGVDCVVIDHHQADERLPDVHALVNPNRQDDISGQGQLCAAGVVFLVLVAVTRELRARKFYSGSVREPDLLALLDLVALATVADVVPLIGLNRAYVKKGLAVMHARDNTGLRALADAAGLTQAPTPYHLGFILGPRINAGGRIGDAALGARLLSTHDAVEAQRIAELLDRLNKERKDLETSMLEEALGQGEAQILADPSRPLILVGSEAFHKGIVGLVASRLTERFQRPSCVIAWENASDGGEGEGTGSLRSIPGIDLGAAVRAAVAAGHLVKGGGHAMAAGLTVKRSRFSALTDFLVQSLAVKGGPRAAPQLEIDAALIASGATGDLVDLIERAGPFGQGNPQPRFAFPSHRVKFAKIVGAAHVRLMLEAQDGGRLEAIAFRAAGQPVGDALMNAGGMPLHVAGHLRRDTWGGRERIELSIDDVADPRRCS